MTWQKGDIVWCSFPGSEPRRMRVIDVETTGTTKKFTLRSVDGLFTSQDHLDDDEYALRNAVG